MKKHICKLLYLFVIFCKKKLIKVNNKEKKRIESKLGFADLDCNLLIFGSKQYQCQSLTNNHFLLVKALMFVLTKYFY